MKEYEFVMAMLEGYGSNRFSKTLDAVASAINNKQVGLLNLSVVKSKVEDALMALEIKIRFDALNEVVKGKLTCTSSNFELNGHEFQTLDEVEKAIENKAFL